MIRNTTEVLYRLRQETHYDTTKFKVLLGACLLIDFPNAMQHTTEKAHTCNGSHNCTTYSEHCMSTVLPTLDMAQKVTSGVEGVTKGHVPKVLSIIPVIGPKPSNTLLSTSYLRANPEKTTTEAQFLSRVKFSPITKVQPAGESEMEFELRMRTAVSCF